MKILAAIVTYNRSKLLERCLKAVGSQSRAPDHIIVVNNGSTDNTEELLRAQHTHFITQPNIGGAGGFKRAIDYALESNFDAVWLMDDDGYPASSALELLERNFATGLTCISSVVLREDEPSRFVFPFPVLDRRGLPVIFGRPRKLATLDQLRHAAAGESYPFAHLFNGALIRTDVIRHIGNVNSDFFLMGDEVDYFMRMRAIGPVVSLLEARHLHPDVSKRRLDEVKFYYFVKNSIILNHCYFDKAFLRDVGSVSAAIARAARRNSLAEAFSYVAGRRAPLLWRAISRGLKGHIGPDLVGHRCAA